MEADCGIGPSIHNSSIHYPFILSPAVWPVVCTPGQVDCSLTYTTSGKSKAALFFSTFYNPGIKTFYKNKKNLNTLKRIGDIKTYIKSYREQTAQCLWLTWTCRMFMIGHDRKWSLIETKETCKHKLLPVQDLNQQPSGEINTACNGWETQVSCNAYH